MILSNEKILGIFEKYIDLEKHIGWILRIAKHKVFFFCDGKGQDKNKKLIALMQEKGITILSNSDYQNHIVNYVVFDAENFFKIQEDNIFNADEMFVQLWDRQLQNCAYDPKRKTKLLCATTSQAENFLKYHFISDYMCSSEYNYENINIKQETFQNGRPVFSLQIGFMGHKFPIVFDCDKESYYERLMQTKFNADLPVISFLEDGRLRKKTVIKALEKLSQYANIMVLADEPMKFKAENILVLPRKMFCFAVKYAKVNLVCIDSEDFISCCMHKIPVIPVYSWFMDSMGKFGNYLFEISKEEKTGRMVPFTDILNQDSCSINLLKFLIPIDIEDTVYLKNIINNNTYWKKYRKEIGRICSQHFGLFFVDEPDKRTAEIICNILKYDQVYYPRRVL